MPSEAGERLKLAREKAGYASAEVAVKRFGWKGSTYRSHENGQTANIPKSAADKYARAYKVSSAWLTHGEGEMRPPRISGRNRLERAVRSIPAELEAEAIRYLELLARHGK